MPTITYTPLANIELSANQNSITFSSISQSYGHLSLVIHGAMTGATELRMRFNGDTGTQVENKIVASNAGTGPTNSQTSSAGYHLLGSASAASFYCVANVMYYSTTDRRKQTMSEFAAISSQTNNFAGYDWASSAAVTSITLLTSGSQFSSGTTVALYGILG